MKKTFLTFVFLVSSLTASLSLANNDPLDKLTSEQIRALANESLAKKAKEQVNKESTVSANIRREAEAWSDLGGNMGKAVVGAAKEIGVAANEFANTGLGKLVTVIVVFKLIGNQIVGMLVGAAILLLGASIFIYLITTRFGVSKYEYKPYLFGVWQRKVLVQNNESTEEMISRLVASAVVAIFSFLVGLKTMF